jgi:cytochrome c biogenesis protein
MAEKTTSTSRHSFGQRLFLFLGSMDLAITLLLTLAIASVIGTVLQQNQPYTDYVIKFGPFWFEVFEAAGLYDVYSALWFLIILTLLVISTSVCVVRHTPSMVRDMLQMRTHVQEKSLKAMHHSQNWQVSGETNVHQQRVENIFSQQGFRVKLSEKPDGVLVSAMKGGVNRLGYIFTHVAIIVICLGGLMDSNLPLKFAEWQGRIEIETRDLAVSQVPDKSRLAVGSQAFRGSIHIAEGRYAEVAFVAMRDGYLVQELPFRIEVKDFRIEHYETGQPKSFETDLVIHDVDLEQPLEQTIAVNHPLIYKGYAIYQASFSDGGSNLEIDAWPLDPRIGEEPVPLEIKVFEKSKMKWAGDNKQLEMTEFRPFNINPDPTEEDPDRIRNFGPSIGFKLRSETGEAMEYINYMLPVIREGREFLISGVRASQAEEFKYLYLPVDADGELTAFVSFLNRVRDRNLVELTAETMMQETLASLESKDRQLATDLKDSLITLVAMFVSGGFTQVNHFIETNLPEAERESLGKAYVGMLREMLTRLYFAGFNAEQTIEEDEIFFLEDSVDAIGSLSRYASPVFLLLTDYEHIQASGLQIAKAPGKNTVYLGCALLIAGVFILFYIPQRRFWAYLRKDNEQTQLIVAGMSNRNPREFDDFFEQIVTELKPGNST